MSQKQLNQKQEEVISHEGGPLLVLAGAGTGKTTVVTERIKQLISSGLARPSEVLALTFTEKAASEMEERVDISMPLGYSDIWIMTFHGFGDRILRQDGLQLGFDPRFKLLSEAESIQLIRQKLYEFELNYFRPRGKPDKFISAMLTHFSRLQDEDISTDQYLKWAKKKADQKYLELAHAYLKYQSIKEQEGYMDFGDLIFNTLELFRLRPEILKAYQSQFKYILVDEFQDVNYAQYQLSKLLAGEKANFMATGDDDQSIYRFRGAAVSNILQFRKDYKDSKLIVLTENYRSSQTILDSAYRLIQNNNPDRLEVVEKIDKRLASQLKMNSSQVQFIHESRVELEADSVSHKIVALVEQGYDYKDFAILVRANNHAEPFIRSLERSGIPHQFLGPGKLFKQTEIIDLVAFLKVLYDQNDSQSLFRLLSMSNFEISPRELGIFMSHARKYNLTLFEAFEYIGEMKLSQDKFVNVYKLLEKGLSKLPSESAGQILYDFIEEAGFLQKYINPQNQEAQQQAANLAKFFDKLKAYEIEHEDASVFAVVDWINLATELGESPAAATTDWTQNNAVNILTVHSSKGLEFPIVFLVNLVSQRFPTNRRADAIPIPEELIKESLPEGDFHLQEERRLMYVGMTRAQQHLFLTAADFYSDAKRKKKLSPFIAEALGENKESKGECDNLASFGYQKNAINIKRPDRAPNVKINYLSYSQIETFKICPLHYKLRYLLKLPSKPSAALSFGSSIHAVMHDFYLAVQKREKPTQKLLESLIKENWISVGYESKAHEKDAFKGAQKMLFEYLTTSFDQSNEQIFLEKDFLLKIQSDLKVGGKIDRADKLADGKIEIIDYKTGEKIPSQKEVDKNMQLTLYALAASQLLELEPEQIKLSLYYFEEQKKITTTRAKRDLENLKLEMINIREQIERSDFVCSGHFLCQTGCEYSSFCNA